MEEGGASSSAFFLAWGSPPASAEDEQPAQHERDGHIGGNGEDLGPEDVDPARHQPREHGEVCGIAKRGHREPGGQTPAVGDAAAEGESAVEHVAQEVARGETCRVGRERRQAKA